MSSASWDHYIWSCYKISRKYRGKSLDQRIESAKKHVKTAGELYEDIENTIGPIDTVEPDIYEHWPTAFESVSGSLNKRLMNRIIS